jgi:prepilin-type N-terminal cleavage/methylation domain-containing protein
VNEMPLVARNIQPAKRSGFTLIELLVVIAIIARRWKAGWLLKALAGSKAAI